ncbi:MAG TPA: NAD(P)/FAD-dependent oxidoreductase [Planctomycetota bacterium]|nr:NAD(P)/FAD-dependent oxidoreductase [Planctomycetota bacterium]
MPGRHRVVIIGGGFGGLKAAQALKRAPVDITLIDKRNFHLFQPLLYQVATGALSPANIAAPLRDVLHSQPNTRVLMVDATGIDAERRVVVLSDGELPYDTLILATGARHHYFGKDHYEALAPGLKTVEDATEIRRRILVAFERAEITTDPVERQALMTFVIVGGGPTGVELAGAIAEVSRHTLKGDFRAIDPGMARIVVAQGSARVLDTFAPELSDKALAEMRRLGVEVRLDTRCTDVRADGVTLAKDGIEERIDARTVLWAAGVATTPIAAATAAACACPTDRAGRLMVATDCSLPGRPEVFAIGDVAHHPAPAGGPLAGVAQVALQQGAYVAGVIAARLAGRPAPAPFRYHDKGSMATIGRGTAVVQMGTWHFAGVIAWLMWLFIHILYLVRFQNRLLVLMQWAANYVTRNRSALLITEQRT